MKFIKKGGMSMKNRKAKKNTYVTHFETNERVLSFMAGDLIKLIKKTERVDVLFIGYLRPELRDNKEVVLESVKKGAYIEFASPRLKEDREIVLAAVKVNGYAIDFAHPCFRNDKEVVLEAVKDIGGALRNASRRLKDDEEVVLTAVSNCGSAIEYASSRIRSKKRIFLEALTKRNQFENILQYASQKLRNDPELIELNSRMR